MRNRAGIGIGALVGSVGMLVADSPAIGSGGVSRALRRLVVLSVAMLTALTAAATASAAVITLTDYSSILAFSSDGVTDTIDYAEPVSLPVSGTLTSTQGGSGNTTTYAVSNDGFSIRFDHVRTTPVLAYADTNGSFYGFSPDEDIIYTLLGTYTASNQDGAVSFQARLDDLTTSTTLFLNQQNSYATANESFTLGQTGGDTFNILTGSLTGTLIAGHVYRYSVDARIDSYPDAADFNASATGFATLAFGAIPVPEPGAAALFATGLLAVAASSVRKRRPRRS